MQCIHFKTVYTKNNNVISVPITCFGPLSASSSDGNPQYVLSDNRRGLDWKLVILNTFTARDYISHITVTHRLASSVTLLGGGFQQRTFLYFRASRPRRVVIISHQPHTLTAGFSW
jgi:hypothetical protein